METNKIQWRRIAEGEELPCDSLLMRYDGTITRGTCAGVKAGQDAYYLPFDELKKLPKEESEDDRIRKDILFYIAAHHKDDGEKARWLYWLETQGAHKKFRDSIQIGDNVTRNEDGELINLSRLKRMAKKDEKQGGQKPTEVEHRFKVGDWVVYCNDDVDLITGIEENGYSINNGGYIPFISEGDIRLWTIEDAKDGDVLTTATWTFIFKKYQDKSVYYHCAASTFNDFSTSDSGEFDSNYVHPATKEQRDTLFAKMHEAGYEWSDKDRKLIKKELKEVEDESKDIKKQLMSEMADLVTNYITQKPTEWSEDDEKMLDVILNDINYAQKKFSDSKLIPYDRKVDWLKELKKRVGCEADFITSLMPSDEQIEYLSAAAEESKNAVLESLYQKLKKLKG